LPTGMFSHFKTGLTSFWTSSQLYAGYIWVITFT